MLASYMSCVDKHPSCNLILSFMQKNNYLANLKYDLPAGLVVFLIALPLCLGIALASGAPLFSGMIAGIVGGIVIGFLSGSHTSVSGPAAGLTAVILVSIQQLGTFEVFLLAVILAGVFQLILGFARAGISIQCNQRDVDWYWYHHYP